MQPLLCLPALLVRERAPVSAPVAIFARRHSAGSSRYAMQDRPIERRVDDFVVRHDPLLFNTVTLADRARNVAFDRCGILNEIAA